MASVSNLTSNGWLNINGLDHAPETTPTALCANKPRPSVPMGLVYSLSLRKCLSSPLFLYLSPWMSLSVSECLSPSLSQNNVSFTIIGLQPSSRLLAHPPSPSYHTPFLSLSFFFSCSLSICLSVLVRSPSPLPGVQVLLLVVVCSWRNERKTECYLREVSVSPAHVLCMSLILFDEALIDSWLLLIALWFN